MTKATAPPSSAGDAIDHNRGTSELKWQLLAMRRRRFLMMSALEAMTEDTSASGVDAALTERSRGGVPASMRRRSGSHRGAA